MGAKRKYVLFWPFFIEGLFAEHDFTVFEKLQTDPEASDDDDKSSYNSVNANEKGISFLSLFMKETQDNFPLEAGLQVWFSHMNVTVIGKSNYEISYHFLL